MTLRLVEDSSDNISHTVCYFQDRGEQPHYLYDDFEAAGADVYFCKSQRLYDPRGLYKLFKIIRNKKFDVIHNHVIITHPIGRIVGKVGGANTIISTHDGVISRYRPHFQLLERITRWCDDTTVAYSEGVKESFSEQWEIIHNGINVAGFRTAIDQVTEDEKQEIRSEYGVSESDQLFVNISRYVDQKSQQTAIKAFKHVCAKRTDAHLLVVGYGPREEELRELVDELNLTSHVTITGRVSEIKPYYAAADCFVLTYAPYIKDWGIVSLEAMAAGLPIVATRTENMDSVVRDGQNGYLVLLDDPSDMADAILRLCDPAVQHRFGEAGLKLVSEEFDISKTIEEYEKLYLNKI